MPERYTVHRIDNRSWGGIQWGVWDGEIETWADDHGRFLNEAAAHREIRRRDPRTRILRALMREEIALGSRDHTRAVFIAAKEARERGIPDELLRQAVEDLRGEGLIPAVPE